MVSWIRVKCLVMMRAVGILDKVDGKVDYVDANQDFEEFDCEEMLRHMEPEMLSSVGSQKGLSKNGGTGKCLKRTFI
jgi:hypothetical protein